MDNPFKSLPKPVVVGGIAVTVGLTGFFLYRHHASTGSWFGGGASSTAAAAAGSAIDPVTGLPTSEDTTIDPITNMGYLAEAEQYGSVQAAEAAVSSFGSTVNSGTGSSTQFGQQGSSTLATGAVSASTYTSNAAWDQAAIAGLEDISGGSTYNGVDIASTLGSVLQGQPITNAQLQVWNAAVGEFGQPPMPVSPIIQPATTASTTTTGTAPSTPAPPTTTTTPPTTTTAPPAASKPVVKIPAMPGGVTTSNVTAEGFTVRWNAVSGATSYRIRVTYQSAAVYDQTTTSTSHAVSGLTANHTYTVHVAASNSAGTSSETNGPAVKTT